VNDGCPPPVDNPPTMTTDSVDTNPFFDTVSSSTKQIVSGQTGITKVMFTATDDTGIKRVDTFIDGILVATSENVGLSNEFTSSHDVDFTGRAEGPHSLSSVSVDTADQQATSTVEIWVNTMEVRRLAGVFLEDALGFQVVRFSTSTINLVVDTKIPDSFAEVMNGQSWTTYTQNGDQKISFIRKRENTGVTECWQEPAGGWQENTVYIFSVKPCSGDPHGEGSTGIVSNGRIMYGFININPPVFTNYDMSIKTHRDFIIYLTDHEIGHASFVISHTKNGSFMDAGGSFIRLKRKLLPDMKAAINCLYFKLNILDPFNCN